MFLASWCPYCRRFRPAFEKAAKQNGINWVSVDISDENNKLWDTFSIDIVPTVIVFKDGKAVWRKDGVPGKGLSEDVIKEAVAQVKSFES